MSIIITAFNLAFTLGILIAKRIKEQLKEIVVLIMTVAASVCLMLDGFGAQDIKSQKFRKNCRMEYMKIITIPVRNFIKVWKLMKKEAMLSFQKKIFLLI